MAIVSSEIVAVIDGWVNESHTDSEGVKHTRVYHGGGTDTQANLAAYALTLANTLADNEFEAIIENG